MSKLVIVESPAKAKTIKGKPTAIVAKTVKGKPTVIIATSVKGKGVSYMENQVKWHGSAPNDQQYAQAVEEIKAQM